MSLFAAGCLLTGVSLAALLAAEWHESRTGVWVAKPLASTGFLLAAWGAGALGDEAGSYGRWVFAALVLSFLGDVLLIPTGTFLAGLVSFLLGHVAFAVAFAVHGVAPGWMLVAAPLAVLAVAGAIRWLRPHVDPPMRVPVYAYMTVISAMVVLAVGAVGAGGPRAIVTGALCFYASDLAVARQRFVARTFWNKSWGLPLYYGAQLVLASSVQLGLTSSVR